MMARLPGPKSAPGDKRRRLELQQLYAELPTIECRGLCSASCGPVLMGRVEWNSLIRAGGERKIVGAEMVCPYLEQERCSVYEVRPMICRLWGVVESMPCPHGCSPSRYLTKEEGFRFLERAREIQ